jgi:hypothetical protein
MVSLFKNTQNDHPTKGATLKIQVEISKKQTNFGLFVPAKRNTENVHQSTKVSKKKCPALESRTPAFGDFPDTYQPLMEVIGLPRR